MTQNIEQQAIIEPKIRVWNDHIGKYKFAVLIRVIFLKLSCKNKTWRVNIEANKHYFGIKTISAASTTYFGANLARVLI